MKNNLSILKGVHPGIVLEMELKHRKLSKRPFALSINEHPQTLGAITKGKRNMNTALALKIEHELGLEEGYFMILQVYYEIKEEKQKQRNSSQPDLSKLRPALFWDTRMDKIDWQQHKRAVIQRIFGRGDEREKAEITRFYGKEVIDQFLNKKS